MSNKPKVKQSDWHNISSSVGVLVVNLGSPSALTQRAARRFLYEFLSDSRVVDLSRWLWLPILHALILPIRPRFVLKKYAKIWTSNGSPLHVIGQSQKEQLKVWLQKKRSQSMHVELAMCYGDPSIEDALGSLFEKRVRHIVVLPLYPQYSATTTAAVFDQVTCALQRWRWLPRLSFVNEYASDPGYINALAESIKQHWQQNVRAQQLLFSFHGIPQRYFKAGDPYYCFCHKTARLVAEQLGLAENEWQVVFQSRFGREPWLEPYCDGVLKALPKQGVTSVDVICPGFAADCLETLEEIDITNRKLFLDAGGEDYHYIPALNDSDAHMEALADIVLGAVGTRVEEREKSGVAL